MLILFRKLILVSLSLLLIGCATTQPDIDLPNQFWTNSQHKVLIAMVKPPKAQLIQPENSSLVAVVINDQVMKNLTKSLDTINWRQYTQFAQSIANDLSARRISSKVYPEFLSSADLQQLPLSMTQDNQELLLITINTIGVKRYYSLIIPNTPPLSYFEITAELINLHRKKIIWRKKITVAKRVVGEWDEAPNYPNFKSTYYSVLEIAKTELMKSLQQN